MKAIILNAANKMNQDSLMLKNGETVLERQLRILSECGICDFYITVSSNQREDVLINKFSHLNITLITETADLITKLQEVCSEVSQLNEDFLLLEGNLVFNRMLAEKILASDIPVFAAVNKVKKISGEGLKARVIANVIYEISENIFDANCFSLQPLYKINRENLCTLSKTIIHCDRENNLFIEDALNEILSEIKMFSFSCEEDYIDNINSLKELERVAEEIRQFDFDEQIVLLGPGKFIEIPNILIKNQAKKILLVCDQNYERMFLSDYFKNMSFSMVELRINSVPSYEEIAAGAELFHKEDCDFIISVGGSSVINTAKAIKLFSALNSDKDFLVQELKFSHIKHLAIPTTAGRGSESTCFTEWVSNGEKRYLAHDCMIPEYILLEPQVLETLPEYHKKADVLCALSQCIEAIWAVNSNEKSRYYAQSGMKLIMDNIMKYLKNDISSYSEIFRAANYSGRAINISGITAASVMGEQLSSYCGIHYGHAVGLCLLNLWKYTIENMDKHVAGITVGHIRKALNIYNSLLDVGTDEQAILQFECILEMLNFDPVFIKDLTHVDQLTNLAIESDLSNNPVTLEREGLKNIYKVTLYFKDTIFDEIAVENKKRLDDLKELKELQALELEIMLMLDNFCKQHNLTYYLGEGTLLGAIRHGGFIPWDDDVDILMPRKDYDKFVRLAQKDLPAGYNLDCIETNSKHWVLGAKIQIVRKTKFVQEKVKGLAMYCGPYVDIFPLDFVPKKFSLSQWTQEKKVRFFRRMLFIKTGFSLKMKGKIHRYAMRLFSYIIPTTTIHKYINKNMRKFNNHKNKAYMVNLASYYTIVNETFPRNFFGSPRYVSFEDYLLPIPQEAEYMLQTIYGDYMKLPSPEKRKKRHSFTVDNSVEDNLIHDSRQQPQPPNNSGVSVIVPVYNVEAYLSRCLDSLVGQTLKNIEIIVVNDGSPDNSQKIIDWYKDKHPDKIISCVKKNGGLSDARNYGIKYATYDYIGFVDSDDYVALDMFEKMLKRAEETNSDVVVCSINRVSDVTGKSTIQNIKYKNSFGHSLREAPEILLICRPYAWNKIYKRELFFNNHIQFPVGQCFEDSATIYKLLLMAKKIELMDEPLYYYVTERKGSITHFVDERIFDILKSCQSIIDFYKEQKSFDLLYKQIEEQCRTLIFTRLNSLKGTTDIDLAIRFLDAAYSFLDQNFKAWRNNPYYIYSYRKKSYRKKSYNVIKRYKCLIKAYYKMPKRIKKTIGKLYKLLKNTKRKKKRYGQYDKQTLKNLQSIELDILKTVSQICNENGLRYYLLEGTLLGAIRHNGFIPWDDDVDIAMPRKDYDRFISIFGDSEINNCILLNETTVDNYYLPFTKVVTTKKTGFKNVLDKFTEKYSGPYIDIFPLDNGVENETEKRVALIRKYRDMLLLKERYIKAKTFRRKIYKIMSSFYTYEKLHRKLRQLMTHYNSNNTGYITNYASSYPPRKATFPAHAFGIPKRITFEDILLPVPRNADVILKTIYNNYMELPPPNKRSAKHGMEFQEVNSEQLN